MTRMLIIRSPDHSLARDLSVPGPFREHFHCAAISAATVPPSGRVSTRSGPYDRLTIADGIAFVKLAVA
jgi:hypothetical protein